MRLVSWLVVLGSIAWLIAGTQGFRPNELSLPAMSDAQLAGTSAPALPSPPAKAAVTTSVAYADIFPLLAALESVAPLDRVEATLTLKSNLPKVRPQDIHLSLEDNSGRHVFKPDADGRITLPVRADWRDAGLVLHSNQPQQPDGSPGTELSLTMHFAIPPKQMVDYAWLRESVRQMQQAMDAFPENAVPGDGKVEGLVLQFPPGSDARVHIASEVQPESYTAGPNGVVRIPIIKSLEEENPPVELSMQAARVGPWVP